MPALLPEKKDCDAYRVRDCGHRNDFHGKTQPAWNVDNRVDGEKNRGQRDDRATDRRDAQPDRSARTNCTRAKDRYREHREVDDSVENIRRVIDKLKCFLNSGADLARDGNHKRDCADKDDRVNGRLVSRMQTREPVWQQSVPSRDHG